MAISTSLTVFFGVDVSEDTTRLREGVDSILFGLTAVWSVGSVWLRIVTDSPIFKKQAK
jgi:hypothetical protein